MKQFAYFLAIIGLAVIVFGLVNNYYDHDAAPMIAGSPAPDFQVKTLDGKTVSLSNFRGKVVVVDFWASWCAPCMVELPLLQQVADKQDKSKVAFLAINVDIPDAADLKGFVTSQHIGLPVYTDVDNAAASKFQVNPLPTLFVIDANGKIHNKHEGVNPDTFKEELSEELAGLVKKQTQVRLKERARGLRMSEASGFSTRP